MPVFEAGTTTFALGRRGARFLGFRALFACLRVGFREVVRLRGAGLFWRAAAFLRFFVFGFRLRAMSTRFLQSLDSRAALAIC
jgi:hypothetical protein